MLATLRDRTGNAVWAEIVEQARGAMRHPEPGETVVTRFGLITPAPVATHEAYLLQLVDGTNLDIESASCWELSEGRWYVVAYAEHPAPAELARLTAPIPKPVGLIAA